MQRTEIANNARGPGFAELIPEVVTLWSESLGHSDICVAILDGPVDRSHPSFSGADIRSNEIIASPLPDEGAATVHGSHVASIIFGQHDGPLPGIAPGCRGLIIPVFSSGSDGTIKACSQLDLARAITSAVQQGAHVINISAGQLAPGGAADDYLAKAVSLCADHGVLIVAAAGNDGCECLHVPAALPAVLAVGAMNSDGIPLNSSNWGSPYQLQGILAPGKDIPGAAPGGGIARRSGTSFATPIVSGVAALLLSIQRSAGHRVCPHTIRNVLLESATPCVPTHLGGCDRFLAGSLNILAARAKLNLNMDLGTKVKPRSVRGHFIPLPTLSSGLDVISGPQTSGLQVAPSAIPHNVFKSIESEDQNMSDENVEVHAHEVEDARSGAFLETINSTAPVVLSTEGANAVTASSVNPSHCGCGGGASKCGCGGGKPPLAYALGELGYDYETEARRDSFIQAGLEDPHNPAQLVEFLRKNPPFASAVIWTLNQDSTPIYAIVPAGPYASDTYERLRDFLQSQLTMGVERVSIPGIVKGKVTLLGGQTVPVIVPEYRGMYSWSTSELIESVVGPAPNAADAAASGIYRKISSDVSNFLERVYYVIRNLGIAPQERAVNYAATNAFQVEKVFELAIKNDFNNDGKPDDLKLDSITAEVSPICRPGSDCWDVRLTFFNPARRFEQAKHVFRFTVDVSDVVPVTVGKVRHWDEY